ncbi:OLC1v1006274C2 [Oldenlandia corymbosa var. corymbosa]|uniref:OLC1v1006274C2 n=1 Tax=Oldenlandia corymbosa var. corymbosa TaxID=529605 RepID=A0AAV1DGL1_OLDCO|nr:OLC1v1006274C2 [Oldenlandia corymbosa var. corymbosa]
MAHDMQTGVKKRKFGHGNPKFQNTRKGKKFQRGGSGQDDVRAKKMDPKTKKFFQKRIRDYNSDDDDGSHEEQEKVHGDAAGPVVRKYERVKRKNEKAGGTGMDFSDDEMDEKEEDSGEEIEVSEDEDGEIQPGVLRFSEGCKAFRLAFKKLTKKTGSADEDILGPVLKDQKKLVAEKLAEVDAEQKIKSVAKKKKHLVGEKGHVKLVNLDSHEKSLIGIATKGVVKLFNAVNKAQHAQKGLNPGRFKDEKVIKKRRKEAFFSALGQSSSKQVGSQPKVDSSSGTGSADAPAWAPLRDNYMLANSKKKDWDKMQETTTDADDFGLPAGADSSSDDDE